MDKYSAPVEMGYKTHNAYETETQVIVCGDPGDNENHNCDEMGCTSVSHVLFRFDKDEIDRLTEENEAIKEQNRELRHPLQTYINRGDVYRNRALKAEAERDMYKEGSDVLVEQLAAMIKARDDYRDQLVWLLNISDNKI